MGELTDDQSVLDKWIGRSEEKTDVLDPRPAALMNLLMDESTDLKQDDVLPPLWHWLYFLEGGRQSELGRDGHLKLGDFLPPVSLPRRMWAGGRVDFYKPLKIGETVSRHSTIKNVAMKQGKTGNLCFVTVEHDYRVNGESRMNEIHDIVYRDKPSSASKPQVKLMTTPPEWSIEIQPDPVRLFRYSALTFNGHRIHYDRDFCLQEENYPGLVFHGPLTATLLIHYALKQHEKISINRYDYRAVSPIFDIAGFTLNGKQTENKIDLWASLSGNQLAMQAELYYSEL